MNAGNHVRAILALPFMVLIVIPSLLLYFGGFDTLGWWQRYPAAAIVLPLSGAVLAMLGLTLMGMTIRLFVLFGEGTLAPWNPTRRLVVRGIYRHVRNPMITGVCLVLLGEATAAASALLFGWATLFIIANMIVIPFFEEPGLVARFGDRYTEYRRHVPRWIPQCSAWRGDDESD